ncbi:endonuclease/exonuclease/phosphatase family protein [Roseimicrobium gellanilyticum]|uniref:endonuclease/exonuclease/phosphatase family protein n=1 Tax=Roseimicrobium gellanilyticum TaxID=748857 RepID=UPI001FE8D5DF|nr:endonuclease/exonuclease/phosphatase family protein [Roseimicrobium gellanilyticum]
MTWNLEWFPGKKPNATQEQRDQHFLEVASVVPQFRADILILQEVRDLDSVEKLAKLLPGFEVHVVSSFKDQVGGVVGLQQIAILSRFKAEGAWAESWKRGWVNAPRGYAYAKLMVSGKPLHVYGIHLKSNLGDAIANTSKREDAVEQLLDHIKTQAKEGEAVVVGGDFNVSKEQSAHAGDTTLSKMELAGFFWSFEGVPLQDRITIPGNGRYPDACFDHLYLRDLGRPVAWVLKDIPGSDHFPVVVDVAVPW